MARTRKQNLLGGLKLYFYGGRYGIKYSTLDLLKFILITVFCYDRIHRVMRREDWKRRANER